MPLRDVYLQYSFERGGQRGGQIENPLFDLLSAVHDNGSIHHAARALGWSYRHVWGELKRWEKSLGEALVTWSQGQPARLTPFARRLLWAEARARAQLTPHIEALRAELERVLSEALDGSQQVLTVFASHDPALPLLREHASAAHRLHIELKFMGSVDALRALAEGRCTVAGFHVPRLPQAMHAFASEMKPLLKPGRHKLIGCMRRSQGLMLAPGNPLHVTRFADLTGSGARFASRQRGSGTRLLSDHLFTAAGGGDEQPGQPGLVEDSHIAAAAAVASGAADAAVGVEAAARQFGLHFVPLTTEDYFLVCLRDALDQPPVVKLREALRDSAWSERVGSLPGHAAERSGEVLSLTRALPWWRFRTPKRRS